MSPTRIETHAVARFTCLGSACPDTCCAGWGMQVTSETINKITREAPELLDAITTGESEFIMKRDPISDACVRLDGGWCSIHRDYGENFLGEACRFFPRVTRAVGDTLITSAALSCPEIARLTLYTDDALVHGPRADVHTPFTLRDSLPATMTTAHALVIHQWFLDMAGDTAFYAEHNFMRLSAVVRAIEMQPIEAWPDAVPFYAMMAESRIPKAELSDSDPFNLLHALYGLMMATPKPSIRLRVLIGAMAAMLGVRFDSEKYTMQLTADAASRTAQLRTHMAAQLPALAPLLRRYLQAQLSQAFFPFAGFGDQLRDRITIIGVRLATVQLALATLPVTPDAGEVVRVVQTVSRFLDHLADPTLSMQIYHETGWDREARLRGLLATTFI